MAQLYAAVIGIVVLILNNKTAVSGAAAGIDLCIRVVIPSLFPMMVLAIWFTGNASGRSCALMRPLCRKLGIPAGAESILLTGLLGGYPTGAKCIASAHTQKYIRTESAKRMLIFCNNAGPGFIFGMAHHLFEAKADLWMLWIIHVLSALCTGLVLSKEEPVSTKPQIASCSLTSAVMNGVKTMAIVCGWIILFKVFSAILDSLLLCHLQGTLKCAIYGVLELTNGIYSLTAIEDTGIRFMVASAMLSFGGVCIFLQTRSIAGDLFGHYIGGKLLQVLISVVLSALWNALWRDQVRIQLIFISGTILFIIIFAIKLKFPIDFMQNVVYNGRKQQA